MQIERPRKRDRALFGRRRILAGMRRKPPGDTAEPKSLRPRKTETPGCARTTVTGIRSRHWGQAAHSSDHGQGRWSDGRKRSELRTSDHMAFRLPAANAPGRPSDLE